MTANVHTDYAGIVVNVEIDEAFAPDVDSADIVRAVEATLQYEEISAAEITLAIADDETVCALNAQYRGIDTPTDVLSFAASEQGDSIADGDEQPRLILPPELAEKMGAYLGDIVIAYPYALRQAGHYGNSVSAELRLLAVHGTLHLLGYDHDTADARAAMWARQDAVLTGFGDQALSGRTYDD